jgi:protein-L-isoaspartate(D-aspartate) O-methyltransferase
MSGGGYAEQDEELSQDRLSDAQRAMFARAELADQLRASGRADAAVEAAFREVPRHIFLPKMQPAHAYQDRAFVTNWDGEGLPVSASTQPTMMAVMLGQLELAPGHRVLEVGTGTGYNAALLACLTGSEEAVVTIDLVPELVEQARANLAAAGYEGVRVACGDGAAGVPGHAPYDRIIVTTGAWDLAPQWRAQLGSRGRMVLPLSIRGIQLSVGLERARDHLVSTSVCRCSFIRMAGAMIGPESFMALGPHPGLHAQVVDGPDLDADGLYRALSGPAAQEGTGLWAASITELADLDLWLTLAEPGLTRLSMLGRHEVLANPAQQRIANLLPLGGLAQVVPHAGVGVAALASAEPDARASPFEIVACGYGPGGQSLAKLLARQAIAWEELGRPGAANLELSAWPPGAPREAIGGASLIIDRPHMRLAVRWSAS